MRLPEVQTRVRFLGLGLMMLALGGCAPTYSVKKIDEAVDPTDRFVAFEAEVPRNFTEFGECVVEEKKRNSFEPDYFLYGIVRTVKTYQIDVSDEWLGKATTLMRIRRIGEGRSKLSITPLYDPLAKSFKDIAGLDQLIATCAGGPLENVQEYSDNSKRYGVELVRESLEQFRQHVAAVELPDYELEKASYMHPLLRLYRSRPALKDMQFFEAVLAGELKPFEAFYTRDFYYVSLRSKDANFTHLQILADPMRSYLKEADPKVYSMFCSGYAISGGLFSPIQETDERIVVLVQGRLIRDAMIVPKDHPFYQTCLQGTEIGS